MQVAGFRLQIWIGALAGAILLQSGLAVGQSFTSQIADPEAYAVYAAVLATGWPKPDIPRTEIALQDKTATHGLCAGWEPSLGPEWQPILQDYSRQNETTRRLQPDLDLHVPYTLITSEKYEDLIMIAAGDANNVYADFWGGMSLAFSAVGFDSTKARAMATLQYSCPSGCGGGREFLLEKQNGQWIALKVSTQSCEW